MNIWLRRNSDAQVDTGLAEPELEKIFLSYVWSLRWSGPFCAVVRVQLCCMLLFGTDDVIYHFKGVSRNWDQAATLQNRRLSHCAGKLQDKLGGILIFQIFCISLIFLCHSSSYISLFLSILRCQKIVEIHVETGKAQDVQGKVESVRKSAGAPSCSVCE